MNETTGVHIYEYDDFSFKLFIPDYWSRIYKGQPIKKLYHDYCVMLDLVKRVDKSKWILDVGANHGIFSVPAAMLGYNVLAFEPVRSNYENIKEAIVENNLTNLDVYNLALSNENGHRDIYVPVCKDNASFSADAAVANMKIKDVDVERVATVRFDDWVKDDFDLNNFGFIKIDVQGAEFDVLSGMKEFLTNAHDIYMIVEYEDHLLKMGYTFHDLDELIISYGFTEQPKILPNDKLFYKQ